MSDKSTHSHSVLFAAWLEGRLSREQQSAFEQRCVDDQNFAARVAAAEQAGICAEQYHNAPLPMWNKQATFDAPEQRSWWRWQGLPAMSMAVSLFAIVLVLTGAQLRIEQYGLRLSFSSQQSHEQVEQLVNQRIASWQQQQQQLMGEFAHNMQQQQLNTSTQLTEYLLKSSRRERKEDFAELIQFINQQRTDDQYFYARQLTQLEARLYQDEQSWSGVDKMNRPEPE